MGKKSRKSSGKPAGQFTEQQVWNNSLKTFKEVCAKIAGPDAFAELSKICVLRILSSRYPAIRIRPSKQSGIHPSLVRNLDEIFKNMLTREMHFSPAGESVSLNTYMREGLMLLHYVEIMGTEGLPDSLFLKNELSSYHRQGNNYLEPLRTVVQILCKFCVIMTDWKESIFVYDINQLCALIGANGSNEVLISSRKPNMLQLKLDNHTRELIRAGWSTFDGTIIWQQIKPKWVGFREGDQTDKLCDVYIQRHALLRLEERVGLVPGIMHEAICETLRERKFRWHKRSEKRLVEYRVMGKHLGYLVCSFDQGLIIIRSFLFLTNTGTPEGNKLSELTSLQSLDKEYLGIDTLLGFARFKISDDATLSDLFIQAGCEDLMDLDEIIRFTKREVKGQDTELLLNYLKQEHSSDNLFAGEFTEAVESFCDASPGVFGNVTSNS